MAISIYDEERIEGALFSPSPLSKKKFYSNDLCPCGSGKKYKKCCGKK